MTQRLDYSKIATEGMTAFNSVHSYVGKTELPSSLIDLVYLRVSQINGCAYCIDLHTRDLIKQGITIEKLMLTSAWHEAGGLFSEQERAALAWAETVTRVSETNVPDADYKTALAHFSEKELIDLTIAISLMNAYNRMAISFRSVPVAARHT